MAVQVLPALADEELQQDVSAGMVALYSEHFPSRATMAETFINKNVVVCVLEVLFDDTEQKLIENGGEGGVLERRTQIQKSLESEFTAVVERVTNRRVLAFMSTNHGDPALAAELFVLERDGVDPGSGRII